jgi:glycosyltransferase involved in cell wall biosynthesis
MLGFRGIAFEFMRDIANFFIKFDPFMLKTFQKASRIYVTTEQTKRLLPIRYQKEAKILLAVGSDTTESSTVELNKFKFKVLYVGRFIYWKGMKFGIYAFARLLESVPNSLLTLVGEGPEKKRWKILAKKLGIEKKIDWVPWIEQKEIQKIYRQNCVFLFPSIHDSGGQVVLEAMAQGLPIVCLDAGGPGGIVTKESGIKVPVTGIKAEQIVEKLANALIKIATDRAVKANLSSGALSRIKEFSWKTRVKEIYSSVHL